MGTRYTHTRNQTKLVMAQGSNYLCYIKINRADNEPGPPGNSEIAVIHNSAAATLNNSPNNCTKCQSRKRIMGHIKIHVFSLS